MLLSCIIPVYNCADFLPECLNSILNIKLQDMEIILIDDGSKDNSYEICKEYSKKDPRIHVEHQENAGVSSARNKGIRLAKGDYILFVDSDDKVVSHTIDKFAAKGPSKDFYLYDYYLNDDKNYIKRDLDYSVSSINDLKDYFYFFGNNMVWNNLYKSEIIHTNKLYFTDGMRMGEDYIFNIKYLEHISSFQIVGQPIYIYRSNSNGSLTNSFNMNYIHDYILMFDTTWPYVELCGKEENFNWNIYINGIYLNSFAVDTKYNNIFDEYENSFLCKKINGIKPRKIKMKIKVWYLKHSFYRNSVVSYVFEKLFVKYSYMIKREYENEI